MRLSGWRTSCAMALGLLALAFYQGCGGDDDNGPVGPGDTTWNDAASGALSFQAVPALTNTASATWLWWSAVFVATDRPGAGEGAAPDGGPTYDTEQEAWLFSTGPYPIQQSIGDLTVTSTVQTDYRVQYLGPDGPQQYCTGADRMTFVLTRDVSAEIDVTGGDHYVLLTNYHIDGNVTYNALTGLTPVYTGSGTGTLTQVSGSGSHTPVDLDPFTFTATFGAFQDGFCPTGAATIDMGRYETQLQFANGEADWQVKFDGAPLNPAFGSTEILYFCNTRGGGRPAGR